MTTVWGRLSEGGPHFPRYLELPLQSFLSAVEAIQLQSLSLSHSLMATPVRFMPLTSCTVHSSEKANSCTICLLPWLTPRRRRNEKSSRDATALCRSSSSAHHFPKQGINRFHHAKKDHDPPWLRSKPARAKRGSEAVEVGEEGSEKKGTMAGAVALIVGTSIGSGILALPKKASSAVKPLSLLIYFFFFLNGQFLLSM